jgi:ferredoxin
MFGDAARATRYGVLSEKIKFTVEQRFYNKDLKRFVRAIHPAEHGDTYIQDSTLDSTLLSLARFGLLEPKDPRMVATVAAVSDELWVKTPTGGLARFEASKGTPGDPSCIATIWLGQYLIDKAESVEELKQAIPILEWVLTSAGGTGFLRDVLQTLSKAEPATKPSIWAHSEFVIGVMSYLEKLQRLNPCKTCGQPIYRMWTTPEMVPPQQEKAIMSEEVSEPELETTVNVRQDQKEATLTIDLRECLGCGLCTVVCRSQTLTLVRHKVQANPEHILKCDVCLECENACPVNAIRFLVSEAEK